MTDQESRIFPARAEIQDATRIACRLAEPGGALFWGRGSWSDRLEVLLLSDPAAVQIARRPDEIDPLLDWVETEQRRGRYVAGFLCYEAGAAFGLSIHPPHEGLPLGWMAAYEAPRAAPLRPSDLRELARRPQSEITSPRLNLSRSEFNDAVNEIRELIAAGDTYQVNLTCRARFPLEVAPLPYFVALALSHPVPYAAYLNIGEAQVLSLSPELFLQRRGSTMESRPMKGTRPRAADAEEDERVGQELTSSEKDRAENIMIVDMVRNDLGKVCFPVRVPALFTAERYRSVWQMTGTVTGDLLAGTSLAEIMEATFPGASVTGAPKHRTMQIIRRLESEPRGVYTGAIGLFMPGGDFTCSLPIRTLVHRDGEAELGLGAGILWDSVPKAEYEETLVKSRFLSGAMHGVGLFETMLLDASRTYWLEQEHIRRIARSALYWDIPFKEEEARALLSELARESCEAPAVVRLDLDAQGELTLSVRPVPERPAEPVSVLLSAFRTDPGDRFLRHKTTNRHAYDEERRRALSLGFWEVLFCNTEGNVTEGATTNIFARFGDTWVTPPTRDGLLEGAWRHSFMRQTDAVERSISPEELRSADEVVVGNSVRGRVRVGEISPLPQAAVPPAAL